MRCLRFYSDDSKNVLLSPSIAAPRAINGLNAPTLEPIYDCEIDFASEGGPVATLLFRDFVGTQIGILADGQSPLGAVL